jgi:hypothetical protein
MRLLRVGPAAERMTLEPGTTVYLLPRRVTRFSPEDIDPAAMI